MAEKDISYWLMKSEPSVYSIEHLKEEKETIWDGIRNYQARNYMRKMNIGDKAFFYHSNCKPPGIIGLMEVIEKDIIDPTQFDKNSNYFDSKSNEANPRWDCVKLKYLGEFERYLSLKELSEMYDPEDLTVVKKGNRLSIIPVKNEIAKSLLKGLGSIKI